MSSVKYVVITPARNEEAHLPTAIAAVCAQTIRPTEWVIVNDGSADQTATLIEDAAARNDWIRGVHRPDRGTRRSGAGVMEAVHSGLEQMACHDWDFLVKLDADLSFEPDYFEACFARFRNDPRLGIAGGTIWILKNDHWENDGQGDPRFHVRGATKIYRRACWEAIGGLPQQTGWDTLDEVKANMLGWKTCSFPELRLIQRRKTGARDGTWRDYFKNGRANYCVGYHPLFMLAKCCKRLSQRPYGLVSLALLCGFVTGYLTRREHVIDHEVRRYLRRQQISTLLGRESLWTSKSVDGLASSAAVNAE